MPETNVPLTHFVGLQIELWISDFGKHEFADRACLFIQNSSLKPRPVKLPK